LAESGGEGYFEVLSPVEELLDFLRNIEQVVAATVFEQMLEVGKDRGLWNLGSAGAKSSPDQPACKVAHKPLNGCRSGWTSSAYSADGEFRIEAGKPLEQFDLNAREYLELSDVLQAFFDGATEADVDLAQSEPRVGRRLHLGIGICDCRI
jgi:hypothetical protein